MKFIFLLPCFQQLHKCWIITAHTCFSLPTESMMWDRANGRGKWSWLSFIYNFDLMIWDYWIDEMNKYHGIIQKDSLVILLSLKKQMLKIIYTGHLGIVKRKQRSRDTLFDIMCM